jgi:GNAT superfamily N-acetyltransferase
MTGTEAHPTENFEGDDVIDIIVEEADSGGVDGRRLIEEAGRELHAMYPEIPSRPVDPAELAVEGASFMIGTLDGVAVACGAIRPYGDSVCELKRMFVTRDSRGKGFARKVLDALEQKAAELGYSEVWLETGYRQLAAIRLYESSGYQTMPCFGKYAGDPISLCYRKKVGNGD